MEDDLILMPDRLTTTEAYEVFKDCMYMPTYEKYLVKVDSWLHNEQIKAHAYLIDNQIKGMIVILLQDSGKAEILGISVDDGCRSKGIGFCMIRQMVERYQLKQLMAETDDDAICFYQKCGFAVTKIMKTYQGKEFVRYFCSLGSE